MQQTGTTEYQLMQLRPPAQLQFHGLLWTVTDYSTYDDPNGYETREWLLETDSGKEYYLLREIDPDNPEQRVHWYLSEELPTPKVFEARTSNNIQPHLWEDIQQRREPYPELQVHGRTYQFESQTEGSYSNDEETSNRITWDYWDSNHQWNLAIEAWPDTTLAIYLTRVVKPADFTQVQSSEPLKKSLVSAGSTSTSKRQSTTSMTMTAWTVQVLLAIGITFTGILFLLFG